MTTVAEIAAKAFNAVAAKITDAIHTATINWTVQGAYDPVSGTYSTTPQSDTGRVVVDTTKPIADIFVDYVAGPSEVLLLLEGFSTIPKEGWEITSGGKTRTIKRVQDIVAAGSLFYVAAT